MTALPLIRSFTDAHGVEIVFYEWPVASPRAAIQLVHGLGEHARRYDHVAAALNRAGYAVYATDHRGHGQTGVNMRAAGQIKRQGNVGVGGMRAVYANELQLTDLINSEHPGLAVALIAHSWGSMIGQRILNANSNRFAAVVLSGSTLLVPGILPPGNFNKRWNDTPNKSGFEWLSRNAEVGQKFAADPLNFPESAMEVFGLANTLQLLGLPTKAIRSDLPMLLIAGSEDALGAERGNQFLLKALLRAGLKDVELIIYHGGRHESFNEINQGEVITDVIDWLNGELSV